MSIDQSTDPVEFFPIPDVDGYRISRCGRVQSCWTKHGMKADQWHNMQGSIVKDGLRSYLFFKIRFNGKKKWPVGLHSLLLMTFVGPRPPGMLGCHGNGDGLDNRLSNIRWGTSKSNTADRKEHGTYFSGESCYQAKIGDDDVREIHRLKGAMTQLEVARRFRIAKSNVWKILTGRSWKHIYQEFNPV